MIRLCGSFGEVPEWSIGLAWKACVRQKRTEGSNPSLSASLRSQRSENEDCRGEATGPLARGEAGLVVGCELRLGTPPVEFDQPKRFAAQRERRLPRPQMQ